MMFAKKKPKRLFKKKTKPPEREPMRLKTPAEIELMREAGLLVWGAHQAAARVLQPGVTTRDVDAEVEAYIRGQQAIPLFKGVPGTVPFPAATCISVNEAIVHGMPSGRKLEEGDVVSIDIGVKYNGWCGDAAVTHAIGEIDPVSAKLLHVTEDNLRLAISMIKAGRDWREIARRMQQQVEEAGFAAVRDLGGHGIGRKMWERPQVPNYLTDDASFKLQPGLVLAIEPMVGVGTGHGRTLADHWTIVTRDGSRAAHFEHTVAVTDDGPRVLTTGPNGEGWALGPPVAV